LQFRESADFVRAVAGWNTILEIKDMSSWCLSDTFPVTNHDRWELRGWFQFIGRLDIIHYVGLDCFASRDGNSATVIRCPNFEVVSGTDAVLAEDCNANDRILKVKGGSMWLEKLTPYAPYNGYLENVAFGTNELPNFNVSKPIHKCRMVEDVLEVEVTEPLTQSWSAGTPVRLHRDGGYYHYGHGGTIPSKWIEIKMNSETHPLRPGTNSVAIVVLACHSLRGTDRSPNASGCVLRIRNLVWELRS
jgi:hypothetical protein